MHLRAVKARFFVLRRLLVLVIVLGAYASKCTHSAFFVAMVILCGQEMYEALLRP